MNAPKPGLRVTAFNGYANHPWYRRLFAKLTQQQRAYCVSWIEQHDALDANAFEQAANRMWIDKARPFPQDRCLMMQELIAGANTRALESLAL